MAPDGAAMLFDSIRRSNFDDRAPARAQAAAAPAAASG
jgi:hypothetical protein